APQLVLVMSDKTCPRAAARTLITLTLVAAQDISERWDREALVLPHPHVLDSARVGRARANGRTRVAAQRAFLHPLPRLWRRRRHRPKRQHLRRAVGLVALQ